MKNILCLFAFFFALLGTLPAEDIFCDNIPAAYDNRGWAALVTENKINVRSKPNTNAEKLFQLNVGDVVTVLWSTLNGMNVDGAYARWVKISCDYGTGYVCSRWLTKNFVKVNIENNAKLEYICYNAFYKAPAEDDPDGIHKRYVKDEVLYIQDGTIYRIKSEDADGDTDQHDDFSFLPEKTLVTDFSLELSVEYNTGYEDDEPIILAYENIYINEKNYYRATMFNLYWYGRSSDKTYYFCEIMKSKLFDDDNRGCFPTMSFSAKTFDLREKEWSKTEEKLFPCEYLENIRWVNK